MKMLSAHSEHNSMAGSGKGELEGLLYGVQLNQTKGYFFPDLLK